jgi:murein DD-endopeptidase MepM/ murein hydrolase activator NlpD
MRRFWFGLLLVVGVILPAGAGTGPASAPLWAVGQTGRYEAPLPGPLVVVRGFDPPPTAYGAGHRGVDLRAVRAEVVRAAAPGVVRFAGAVAGRGVIVLGHADGIRTEYEPVVPLVHAGALVRWGQRIGVIIGRHHGCPGVCLHWGARRGDAYLDPLRLLEPLGPVVLLPWRGGPAR